jgi:hypothetical protein
MANVTRSCWVLAVRTPHEYGVGPMWLVKHGCHLTRLPGGALVFRRWRILEHCRSAAEEERQRIASLPGNR